MIVWKFIKEKEKSKYKAENSFNNIIWLKKIKKRIVKNFKLQNKKFFKTSSFQANSPIALLCLTINKNKIKILDFGSGSLETYFDIKNNIKYNKKYDFLFVEVKSICNLYNRLKKKILKSSKKFNLKF